MKIFFTIAILLSAIKVIACRCESPPEIKNKEELKSYDFIALIKIKGLAPKASFGHRENGDIKIEVRELFKGEAIELANDPSFNTSCALTLDEGEQWLFFGNVRNGKVLVGVCTHTRRYSDSTGMRIWWTGYNSAMGAVNKLRELYGHPLVTNAVKKIFYPNGKLEITQSVKNSKLNGLRTVYYPNGTVYMTEQFRDGERIGQKNSYFPDGQIMTHEEYNKGYIKQTVLYHDTAEIVWYLKMRELHPRNSLFSDDNKASTQPLKKLDSLRRAPGWGKQIRSIYLYSKDGRSYSRKFYEFDGKLTAETYLDWEKKTSEHKMYYADGKLQSVLTMDQINDRQLEINYLRDGTKKEFDRKCESCKYYFDPSKPAATPDKAYVQ
jgi:antitoxin component YwqK of YwqJK toxin-antitoxin module